jgi:hypothetical protein
MNETIGTQDALVDKEQVKQIGGSIRERVFQAADQRIEGIVKEIEQIGSKLGDHEDGQAAPVADFVSQFAQRTSDNLRELKTQDLIRLGREQLQQRPGLVLAGLLGVGFLGARMLRR